MATGERSSVQRSTQDWEDLAELDALWAILSERQLRFDKWDERTFLLTGESEVKGLMEHMRRIGYPKRWKAALDYGCGTGRITRWLARYFEECYGVDVSAKMLEKARQMNHDVPNCSFLLNNEPGLRMFPDQHFDLVYCKLVLQHFPTRKLIEQCITELCKTLALEGLLVFQLPSWIPLRHRLQPRRRGYHLLRSLGVNKEVLFRVGLYPIRMTFVSEPEVRTLLEKASVKVLEVNSDTFAGWKNSSRTYYVTKLPP